MQEYEAEIQEEFPSNLEALAELMAWLEQKRPGGLHETVWIQAQTALIEGFTNAVRHAHAFQEPPPLVSVTLAVVDGRLRLGIRDRGAPFDLAALWQENVGEMEEPLGLDGWPVREAH